MNDFDLSEPQPSLSTSLRICMSKGVGQNGTAWTQGTLAKVISSKEATCSAGAVGHWATGHRVVDKQRATRLFRAFALGTRKEISHEAVDIERLKMLGRALTIHVADFDDEAIKKSSLEALELCDAPGVWLEAQRAQMKLTARAAVFWAYRDLPTNDDESDSPSTRSRVSSSFNFGSASVPNTEFDVFVSFASNDDLPNNLARNGWVTEFVHALEAAVRQRLGSANQPRVFFAKRDLKSNQGAKEALAAMDCSACVVALCSPSYLQDAQAKKECLRLARESESPRRLFVVDVLPVSDEETLPDMLASKRRMPFYARPNATSSVAMSFTPEMSEFHNLIHDLAEQIRSQIKAMQTVHEFSDAARYVRDAAIGKKHVLLAQVTEDIEDQREDVRRYLEQFGHRVLPYESYRQDGATFQKQIAADLAKSDLFVQLLGPNQGRCPPDLPVGYVRAQAAMAFDAQVETCQWRVTSLDPDNVQNPDYRDLLTSATVMASGLEAFKASLRDKLDAPVSTEKNEGDRALQTVFINADESDLEYAKTVRDEFVRNGFLAATPAANPKPDLLKEHLVDCDALVLLYGNASHVWADRNLRLFNKLRARRDRPPKVVAVLLGPPPEKADDLTISMPGLKILGDRKGWNEAHLSDVIKEMRDADA